MSAVIPALWCLDHPPLGALPQAHLPHWSGTQAVTDPPSRDQLSLSHISARREWQQPTPPPAQCSSGTWASHTVFSMLWNTYTQSSWINLKCGQIVEGLLHTSFLKLRLPQLSVSPTQDKSLFYKIKSCPVQKLIVRGLGILRCLEVFTVTIILMQEFSQTEEIFQDLQFRVPRSLKRALHDSDCFNVNGEVNKKIKIVETGMRGTVWETVVNNVRSDKSRTLFWHMLLWVAYDVEFCFHDDGI